MTTILLTLIAFTIGYVLAVIEAGKTALEDVYLEDAGDSRFFVFPHSKGFTVIDSESKDINSRVGNKIFSTYEQASDFAAVLNRVYGNVA